MPTEPTTESVLKWLEDATRFANDTGSTLAPTFQVALTLARRGAGLVRVEFSLVDRHGGIWRRDAGDGRWHCGGYEHDTTEELEAVAGPLRPLYAGPVEEPSDV